MLRDAHEYCRQVFWILAVATAIASPTTSMVQADLVFGPAVPVPGLYPNPSPAG